MENTAAPAPLPSQDERIMAALAHGAILVPMTGAIIPVVIWVTQKDKSRYTAFQSFQALVYHLILILTWFLGMGCYLASIFGMVAFAPVAESVGSGSAAILMPLWIFSVFGAIFCLGAIFLIYGLFGAVMTLMGKDFHYLLIGGFLERRWQS